MDVVRRTVRERAVCVACPRLGREVVVALHIRVYYERAGLWGDCDVQVREPELAALVRVVEKHDGRVDARARRGQRLVQDVLVAEPVLLPRRQI